jgi:hypothetical protein
MTFRNLSASLVASAVALGLAAAPAAGHAQTSAIEQDQDSLQQPAPTAADEQSAPQAHRLFRLSSCITCRQSGPTVAGNAAGDVMATWDSTRNVVDRSVFNRVFNAALTPLGSDFLVLGAASTAPQFDSAVAADASGNFVVAWTTMSSDQSTILARRFNVAGRPLGPAVEVASDPSPSPDTPADFNPTVAAIPGGGFVVAWMALPTGHAAAAPPRVMSRRFNAQGAASGAAVQLSTGLALGDRPSVCVSATGRIHAAWTVADSYRPFEPSLVGVVVRRLSEDDVPIGPEQLVSPAVDEESSVAIACGPGNTFDVAWQTAQAPAIAGSDIVVRRFTRLGRAIGAPVVVNQATDGTQKNPSVVADAAGDFVVAWEGNPGGMNGVSGRRFAFGGTPLSDEFPVYRSGQGDVTLLQPVLSPLGAAGGFVVAMNGPDGGAVGRTFSVSSSSAAAAAATETDVRDDAAATGSGGAEGAGGVGGLW